MKTTVGVAARTAIAFIVNFVVDVEDFIAFLALIPCGKLLESLWKDCLRIPVLCRSKKTPSLHAGKPYVPEITVPRSWKRHALQELSS